MGPVTLFGKRAADATWDFLNDLPSVSSDPNWLAAGTDYALSAIDLGRTHNMVISVEQNTGISYEVEVVRHFEVIPGEESPLEVKIACLSTNFSSPLDLIRRLKLDHALSNPFAPPQISTSNTVWTLEPVILAQTRALNYMNGMSSEPTGDQIKGLFGTGLKWLLKLIAPKAIDWIATRAH